MKRNHLLSISPHRGFSLMELLAVLGLIALLAALIVPAFGSINRGRALDLAGSEILNALTLARQHAITMGVRTRWDLVDLGEVGAPNYRIHRVVAFSRGEWKSVSGWREIPASVMLDNTSTRSSLVTTAIEDAASFEFAGTTFTNRKRISVQFISDGTTTITSSTPPAPFLTFQSATEGANPSNWYCLVINPVTGRVESHRP